MDDTELNQLSTQDLLSLKERISQTITEKENEERRQQVEKEELKRQQNIKNFIIDMETGFIDEEFIFEDILKKLFSYDRGKYLDIFKGKCGL